MKSANIILNMVGDDDKIEQTTSDKFLLVTIGENGSRTVISGLSLTELGFCSTKIQAEATDNIHRRTIAFMTEPITPTR